MCGFEYWNYLEPINGSDFQLYDMLDARRINNIIKKKNDLEAIVRIQALQRGRIVRQNVPPVELLVAIKVRYYDAEGYEKNWRITQENNG